MSHARRLPALFVDIDAHLRSREYSRHIHSPSLALSRSPALLPSTAPRSSAWLELVCTSHPELVLVLVLTGAGSRSALHVEYVVHVRIRGLGGGWLGDDCSTR